MDKSGISGWVAILIKTSTGPRQSLASLCLKIILFCQTSVLRILKLLFSERLWHLTHLFLCMKCPQLFIEFEILKLDDFRRSWTSSWSLLWDWGISFANCVTTKLLPNYQTLCKVNSPFILRNLVFVVLVCETLDILISEWRYNKGGHQTFHKFNWFANIHSSKINHAM